MYPLIVISVKLQFEDFILKYITYINEVEPSEITMQIVFVFRKTSFAFLIYGIKSSRILLYMYMYRIHLKNKNLSRRKFRYSFRHPISFCVCYNYVILYAITRTLFCSASLFIGRFLEITTNGYNFFPFLLANNIMVIPIFRVLLI